MSTTYALFDVFGIELEYMIVDRETLVVRPLADRLIEEVGGDVNEEVDRGPIAWSNELVNHVVELKTNGPAPALEGLGEVFHREVTYVNERLAAHGAMLLPTGAHPTMDPAREAVLWPHAYNDVYAAYDRIFGVRGHGWSNLQSTHVNLPFRGDAEFERLHAAIRILLPILPALSAGTPLLDGRLMPHADARLETYRHNQARLPVVTGAVIPEAVFTEAAYQTAIFEPIRAAITPLDPGGVLDPVFLNSRGAIARFDRGAIEIRVLDLQESPRADLAIVEAIVAILRRFVAETWTDRAAQKAWNEQALAGLFLDVVRDAEAAPIRSAAYLALFGARADEMTAGQLWRHLLGVIESDLSPSAVEALALITEHGSLSTRIRRALGPDVTPVGIRALYRELAECLAENRLFRP